MDVELVFIPHSRERMEMRGVTELQIRELLRRYSLSAPGNKPGRMRFTGNLSSGETLSVVIQPPLDETGPYTVITAYFKGEE